MINVIKLYCITQAIRNSYTMIMSSNIMLLLLLLTCCCVSSNPIRRFPLLGGRELDLYHLYTKVKQLGGSYVVTKERNWGEVSRSFNLPSTVTSASYACRQNYLKLAKQITFVLMYCNRFLPMYRASQGSLVGSS